MIAALDLSDLTAAALPWVLGAAFALVGLLCVVLTVIGLPGLWALLLLAGAVELAGRWLSDGTLLTFSGWTLGAAVALAIGAEVYEFAAGAAGARAAGASRRGMAGAVVGGLVGALLGAPFGLILGAIVGGVLGSALGAIVMELSLPGRTLRSALRPAQGAAEGRLRGIAGKLLAAAAIWIGLTIAAFV